MLFNLLYYRQYKRPIMSVNSAIVTSNDYSCCLNRIAKLQQMLELNLSSQERLVSIKQGIEKRKRQLEQIGVLQTSSVRNNLLFSPQSAINELKRTPPILQDQLLLKKSNATIQFQFLKNMTEQKQVKPRKKKNLKFEELSIQNLGANPKVINFRQIANKFGKTGLQLYKDWRDKFKVKAQKKLNSMDDARLKQKRKIYGDNWEKISYFFNGLTFEKLYYYYHENLSGVSSGKWTLRQSLMLITLIDYYGVGKWALISKKLKVKSQFQVRQRFCNVLDPTLKQNKWNDDDARLLLSIASEQKYKWSKIVKKVPRFANKTDNALRRKFRNIMIRQQDDTILKVVKNQKLAESILKFKKNYYNRSKNKKNNMNTNNVTNKKAEDEEDEDQKFKKQQEMIDEADQ